MVSYNLLVFTLNCFDVIVIISSLSFRFRSKLAKIGIDIEKRNEKIKEENERRKADNEIVYQRPYTILLPKNVPNSIAI